MDVENLSLSWENVMPIEERHGGIAAAYDGLIIHSDAVIELLTCCLLPMILHHIVPMLMHVMAIISKMQ